MNSQPDLQRRRSFRDRFPGEFALMANAHALEEGCRPIVQDMICHRGDDRRLRWQSTLRYGRIADEGPSRRDVMTHQKIECGDVRDHQ